MSRRVRRRFEPVPPPRSRSYLLPRRGPSEQATAGRRSEGARPAVSRASAQIPPPPSSPARGERESDGGTPERESEARRVPDTSPIPPRPSSPAGVSEQRRAHRREELGPPCPGPSFPTPARGSVRWRDAGARKLVPAREQFKLKLQPASKFVEFLVKFVEFEEIRINGSSSNEKTTG